jgi:hypothetical protein
MGCVPMHQKMELKAMSLPPWAATHASNHPLNPNP